jgi:hypothetical protein
MPEASFYEEIFSKISSQWFWLWLVTIYNNEVFLHTEYIIYVNDAKWKF